VNLLYLYELDLRETVAPLVVQLFRDPI